MSDLDQLEKTVLSHLLLSTDNCLLFKQRGFTEEFFVLPQPRKLFVVLWYNYEKNLSALRREDLASLLRQSSKMTDDDKEKLTVFYEDVAMTPHDATFSVILDEFLLYYKTHQLSKALTAATSTIADKDPDKAMEDLTANIQQLKTQTVAEKSNCHFFGDPNRDLVAIYEQKRDHPELFRGIELGFPTLDASVTHKPGTVTLIFGQMKSAKSVLMVNIAHNIMKRGKRVYYHVNEGGDELVENRFISCETGLIMNHIDRQTLSPANFEVFKQCSKKFQNSNLLCIDPCPPSHSSAAYIEEQVTKLQATYGKFEVLLIDYMGLMQSNKKVESDWLRYGAISIELKNVAMKLNVPIIVVAHVNRDGMESNKKHFDLNEIGLSLEPLKNVDVIASWRIHDTDFFEMSNTGLGTLSVRGSRQSGQASVVLDVDTTKMKIWESLQHKIIGAPVVSTPTGPAPVPVPVAPPPAPPDSSPTF